MPRRRGYKKEFLAAYGLSIEAAGAGKQNAVDAFA